MLETRIPSGPIEQKWDKCRFEMKLVNPANRRKHSIIVVGAGLAGAAAAATLGQQGYHVILDCFPSGLLCSIRQLAKLANFMVRQLPYFQRVTVGNWFAFLTRERRRAGDQERGKMLRIRRSANAQVVFRLSGRMGLEETVELETLIKSEENGRPIVLDLKDVTLVGQDAIAFLERCEADNITLKNCAAYVREWITRKRESS